MTIHTAHRGDIEIAYETFGPSTGEPLLLLAGQGAQMLTWPQEWCQLLVERGFCVARFDQRDAGLSTRMSEAGAPNQLRMLLRPGSAAVYELEDLADDTAAVLDALGWASAHLVGISMGGMIAQTLATTHPDRARSLTCISSAPTPRIGQPKPRTLLKIIKVANPKRVKTREDLAQYVVDLHRLTGSPAYPTDEQVLRELGRQSFDRGGLDVAAVQRQTAAITASGDRRAALAKLQIPTLVLHGEDDPMIRVEAAEVTAATIPGARLVTYPGMGHDLPRQLWPAIIEEISSIADVPREASPRSTAAD